MFFIILSDLLKWGFFYWYKTWLHACKWLLNNRKILFLKHGPQILYIGNWLFIFGLFFFRIFLSLFQWLLLLRLSDYLCWFCKLHFCWFFGDLFWLIRHWRLHWYIQRSRLYILNSGKLWWFYLSLNYFGGRRYENGLLLLLFFQILKELDFVLNAHLLN